MAHATADCADDADSRRDPLASARRPEAGTGEKIEKDERFDRAAAVVVAGGCWPASDCDRFISRICALSGAPVLERSAAEAGDRRPARDQQRHLFAVDS